MMLWTDAHVEAKREGVAEAETKELERIGCTGQYRLR